MASHISGSGNEKKSTAALLIIGVGRMSGCMVPHTADAPGTSSQLVSAAMHAEDSRVSIALLPHAKPY